MLALLKDCSMIVQEMYAHPAGSEERYSFPPDWYERTLCHVVEGSARAVETTPEQAGKVSLMVDGWIHDDSIVSNEYRRVNGKRARSVFPLSTSHANLSKVCMVQTYIHQQKQEVLCHW